LSGTFKPFLLNTLYPVWRSQLPASVAYQPGIMRHSQIAHRDRQAGSFRREEFHHLATSDIYRRAVLDSPIKAQNG